LAWFGARNVNDFLEKIVDTGIIRPVAKSQLAAFSRDENLAPFEFEVNLRFLIPDRTVVNEYRELMRSQLMRTPYQIAQKAVEFAVSSNIPLSWVDSTVHARDALRVFASLTEKYFPEIAGGYAIFVFCSILIRGDKPIIYHTFGQSTDSDRYLADFGITIFGGPWWGRYYYVDICSLPPPRFLQSITPFYLIDSQEERIAYLASLIDILIDQNLVKSTLYQPRYRMQSLVDIVVIDATVAGVGFDLLTRYFDPEMMEKAYRTLMPYNQFNIRLRKIDLATVPEIRSAIEYTPQGIILKDYTAYEILNRKGIIQEAAGANYVNIPVIILFTTTNSFVDKPGVLGRAAPNPRDPTHPLFASAAIYYEYVVEQGLTALITHEAGHMFGLRHPHDDYDEYSRSDSGFFPLTYFTETLMSYSVSWSAAVQQQQLFKDYYSMRSFWSIFDLDNIDRATIMLLLKGYEENYGLILQTLRDNRVDLKDVPEIKAVLDLAKQYARAAGEEFKRHNYFNRLTFKGLGAQLETSFDYAFAAWLYTENVKNLYLPAIIEAYREFGSKAAGLEQTLQRLRIEIDEGKRKLEESLKKLGEKREELRRAENTVNSLRDEVGRAERQVEQVRKIREDIGNMEKILREISDESARLGPEVDRLRSESTTLTAVVVLATVAGAGIILFSRKSLSMRRRLPPPPPPPP
ncbi:MAG: hypothetical protein NZ581_07020, partial [Candidatus Caldarchaeum sp.]|nr:hypothetical protein [Candidatus Caldarchaeum sp.]MDW8435929.1 hypothetical protein [Candidatus Caldarchaeum sp.]